MSDAGGRGRYFDGQVLRPSDFADEQLYHLELHRRHNVAQHEWGIVAGLDLTFDPEVGTLYVEPGVAADGFGRDLVLAERKAIAPSVFADQGEDALDVYLNYDRAAGGVEAVDPCADGSATRWLETPYLSYEPADPSADRRRPPGVAAADVLPATGARGTAASRALPDDPGRRWPVFLGAIVYDRTSQQSPFTVDPAGRPYAGLVGELIVAPSGNARVQVGAEYPGDTRRFAVFIPGDAATPRLAIDTTGRLSVDGDTTFGGDVTIAGRALVMDAGTERPAGSPPAQLYHVVDKSTGATEQELRIELAGTEQAGPTRFVVGTWTDGAFKPCLTVDNQCRITVHGDLVVEGKLDRAAFANPNAGVLDLGLDEEARRLALATFQSGVAGTAALFARVYKSPFPEPQFLASVRGPEATLSAAAIAVVALQDRLGAFVGELRAQDPAAAAALRRALSEDEK